MTPIPIASADIRQRVADLNTALAGYEAEGLQFTLVVDPAFPLAVQVPTERQHQSADA